MLQKTLSNLIISGLFLTPFLVLIVADPLYFPFITGKNFAFRILVEILFALWLILLWLAPDYRPPRSPLLWAYTALLAILILATIFSLDPARSFWSNYERMEGLISHLHLFAYFLLLVSIFRSQKIWHWFLNTTLGASLAVFFYCLLQLAGKIEIHQGGVRLDGPLGNATYLAVYALFNFFLALFLFWPKWREGNRARGFQIFYGFVALANLFLLYQTQTRGTILGLVGGLLLLALILSLRGERKAKQYALGFLGAIVVLVAAFFFLKDTALIRWSPTLTRLASISPAETTTESRFIIWRMSLKGFQERPILGWGPENYNLVFNKYYDPRLWRQEQWFDRSHDVFFDWLISAGLPGLLTYLSLFVAAIYLLWRRTPLPVEGKATLIALLAAYFFHNIFVFDNLISYLLFFTILAFIHYLVVAGQIVLAPKAARLDSSDWLTAGLIIPVAIFGLYWLNFRPLTANARLAAALGTDSAAERLALFENVFKLGTFGNSEAREQLALVANHTLRKKEVDQETKDAYYNRTVSELGKQGKEHPFDARPPYFLGVFLTSVGQFDQALLALEKAQRLSPHKQTFRFAQINILLAQNKLNEALKLARETYELAPAYPLARSFYALVLLSTGNIKLADELISQGTDPALDSYLEAAYRRLGRTFPPSLPK